MDIDLGFGITYSISCRVWGMNAPELSTIVGKIALNYAIHLCPEDSDVKVVSHGWDKYGGRFDGQITLEDGRDFASEMISSGNAKAYAG
jgi:endonuclease YncB( thermonuclease family)